MAAIFVKDYLRFRLDFSQKTCNIDIVAFTQDLVDVSFLVHNI